MSRDFWSRRREAVAATEAMRDQQAAHAAQEALAQSEAEAIEAMSEAEILAHFDLPDPDKIGPGDDVTGFLRRAVPEYLRRRALRGLWRSNPVLANLDGLVDFDDDFTDQATVKTGMKTAYQVGRGMLDHLKTLVEPDPDAPDPVPEPGESVRITAFKPRPAPARPAVTDYTSASSEPDDMAEIDDDPAAPRRHMRFAFPQEVET